MANQLHVAHSAGIMGAGLVAGGLYGCAVDSVTGTGVFSLASLAVGPCMSVPTLLRPVEFYARTVAALAARGWIDPPSNLARSRIYMFTGQADQVVNSKTIELGASLYRALGVPESQIVFRERELSPPGAGHSWVTKNFGKACDTNASPFINNCTYDQAMDVLSTIYGPLQPPNDKAPLSGRIVAFDQGEFVPENAAKANGMSDTGYLYVPKACEPGAARRCRLHVALHGCLQSAEVLGDAFYTKIGINEWADANGIMVVYPQTHATTVSELSSQNFVSLLQTNLAGCWNWWGYSRDSQYLTKQGVQIRAIWSMVLRLTGQLN
jgi:poly(3-hydroxybutyrate) depolymerase